LSSVPGRSPALVGRAVAHVLPLQEHVHLAERRPLRRVAVPALDHQVVDLARTVARLSQHHPLGVGRVQAAALVVAADAVVDDLVVSQGVERSLAGERQDLPQSNGERPNITLR